MRDQKHTATRASAKGVRTGVKRKNRRKARRNLLPLICLVMVALVILVSAGALMLTAPRRSRAVIQSQNIRPRQAQVMADGDEARQVMILAPAITEVPSPSTPAPTLTATPEATPARPVFIDARDASRTPEATATLVPVDQSEIESVMHQTAEDINATDEGFLPVYKKADTMERRIAITVDDCFQLKNLQTIIKMAYRCKAKLTIFPIGQNINITGMPETLRICVEKLGYEIENHTWSHARVFRLPASHMAAEIWNQSQALNRALGVNYEQHFFRLMGGDGNTDQRTHLYLKKLGYKGIADWSVSGSDASIEEIMQSLQPGAIYLFHTTDSDVEKLLRFIPYAVQQGYELVTLNELLGFGENAQTKYNVVPMPAPDADSGNYRTYQQGEYAWSIVQIQDRLRTMGYLEMEGASTGYYGEQTTQAVMDYQQAEGLPVTGVADSETQRHLLKSSTVT